MIQKTFEIGNSTALTVPKHSGIKPGTQVKFTQVKNKLIYEIISDHYPTLQEKRIKNTSGAFTLNVPNLQQALKVLKDNPYDGKIRIS